MNNQRKTFWMVLGNGTPTFRHYSEQQARIEAERLARMNPGSAFTVLESIATVVKSDLSWSLHHPDAQDDSIPFYEQPMQILVNKKGRTVRLTKRETDLLKNSKALLGELAAIGGGEIAEYADGAAADITSTMLELANQGKELEAPPY